MKKLSEVSPSIDRGSQVNMATGITANERWTVVRAGSGLVNILKIFV